MTDVTVHPEYFEVLTRFSTHPKTNDITLDFFGLLEQDYPEVWERLKVFYADDDLDGDCNPRMHRYEWDRLLEVDNFPLFIQALQRIWPMLSGQNYGICVICEKETELDRETRLIGAYEICPVLKIYQVHSFDGAILEESYICWDCTVEKLNELAKMVEPEGIEFFV